MKKTPVIKKYKKKPVAIEAIQYNGENYSDVCKFVGKTLYSLQDGKLLIPTLEGDMRASKDDFIIKGISGEFYPCKPKIFWKTYDKMEE